MHYWQNDSLEPPEQLLNQCYIVLLTDDDIEKNHHTTPWAVKRWAIQNCKSFVWMQEQDVADVSYQWDYIYAFYFGEEKDANWFQLKWK